MSKCSQPLITKAVLLILQFSEGLWIKGNLRALLGRSLGFCLVSRWGVLPPWLCWSLSGPLDWTHAVGHYDSQSVRPSSQGYSGPSLNPPQDAINILIWVKVSTGVFSSSHLISAAETLTVFSAEEGDQKLMACRSSVIMSLKNGLEQVNES